MDNQSQPSSKETDNLAQTDARAFMVSNAINSEPTKQRPVVLYIAAAAILALVVVVGIVIATKKPTPTSNTNPSGGALTVPTPDQSGTEGFSNDVKNDIKTCSNAVNTAYGKC